MYKVSADNSYRLKFNLVDEDNDPITSAQVGTLYLTQYYYNPDLLTSDRYHLATINNRYNQNVKNANNVTLSSAGTITWEIQPEDMHKLNPSTEEELHVALFTWMWSGKSNNAAIYFYVANIPYSIP